MKQRTRGYSGFGTELIRGVTAIPKESVYFFREKDQQDDHISPPSELCRSITALHNVRAPPSLFRSLKSNRQT